MAKGVEVMSEQENASAPKVNDLAAAGSALDV